MKLNALVGLLVHCVCGFQPHPLQTLLPVSRAGSSSSSRPPRKGVTLLRKAFGSFQNDTSSYPSSAFNSEASFHQSLLSRIDFPLLQQSFCAGLACLTTWALTKQTKLNVIQASSVHGLVVSMLLPAPYAVAAYCGSFAGMSTHLTSAALARQLSMITFFTYGLLSGWQTGKGGRLGAIAFVANSVLFSIKKTPQVLIRGIWKILQPATALNLLLATLLINQSRTNNTDGRKSSSLQKYYTAKAAIVLTLISRIMSLRSAKLRDFIGAAASIYAATLVTKKIGKNWNVVFASSVVGLAGSFTQLAAPVYLGSFVGMSALADVAYWQVSILSGALLELGLLNGFGGKLGTLACLGVNFAL